MDCAHLCLRENVQCQSINIEKARSEGGFICHFNNSTRESHVQKFVKNAAYTAIWSRKMYVHIMFLDFGRFTCTFIQDTHLTLIFLAIPGWVNGHLLSMEDVNILRN
jgi:hypothetical protein